MAGISDFIRRVVAAELRSEADADLLGRFVAGRDEAAFAVLVRRHGALVQRVCRSVLRNEADAEDAAQATFLVLARNAARVRRRGALASWLHGVALRTARKLRARIARRRAVEAGCPPPAATADDLTVRAAQALLHEELDRLPARDRGPLVLCYLQGKTHDEAAAELGWALTTFRGRLERARKRLGDRVRRRGGALPAALLTGALAESSPAVAATFAVRTARAAAGGLASPAVTRLTQEVLRTMSFRPLRLALLTLLAATALAAGGYLASQPAAPPGPAPAAAAPPLTGRILVCRNNRFAWLRPGRPDLAPFGTELEDGELVRKYRVAPDGKSAALMLQTPVGTAITLWDFEEPLPGKVLWTGGLVIDFCWLPDGKQLVLSTYQAIKDGVPADYQFRTLDVATRRVADLKLPDGHWLTDVAPDGSWFLTTKTTDPKQPATGARLYRVERATGEARPLLGPVAVMIPPRWSVAPDGRHVAGLSLDGTRRLQVFVGDLRAGTLRQATREADTVSNCFGWSPDGRRLLYAVSREPAAPKGGDAFPEWVVAADADGGRRTELYRNERHHNAQGQRQYLDGLIGAEWR